MMYSQTPKNGVCAEVKGIKSELKGVMLGGFFPQSKVYLVFGVF